MREIAFGDAKAHLSELLAALEAGQMVTIMRDDKTVASVILVCGECSGRLAALMRLRGLGATVGTRERVRPLSRCRIRRVRRRRSSPCGADAGRDVSSADCVASYRIELSLWGYHFAA